MPRDSNTLIGLTVGTTKISVIVAERDSRFRDAVQIIGVGSAPSMGIRKGLIVNLEKAIQSVKRARKEAENMVGFPLTRAVVSFSADDVSSVPSKGIVSLGGTPRQIRLDDVERVIEDAQSQLSIPRNEISLHTIPVSYSIDGSIGIDDPLGMTGTRLAMDLQTVTVPSPYIQNVINCAEGAGIHVEGLVVKPLSAALGALTEEEMRAGVISICIGGGTTSLAFYRDGRPTKVVIIQIGGDHITNDLANVLRLTLKKAEELKKRLFSADDENFIILDGSGNAGKTIQIETDKAIDIIRCRLDELFTEHVLAQIPEHNPELFPAGIVLSGGVAKTPDIDNFLMDIFKMPVRVAEPEDYYEMPPGRNDASYVNAVGTIKYILSKERSSYRFIDPPDWPEIYNNSSLPSDPVIVKQRGKKNNRKIEDVNIPKAGDDVGLLSWAYSTVKKFWAMIKELLEELL
ncbi:cell division protein FtsA [Synergistales bacterium]|nr:cell division protein FtsA [Synergistales bacterium]